MDVARFMSASGLSGLSSSDLSVGKSLIKVAEIFIDAAQVHVGIGVIRLEPRDLSVRQPLTRLPRPL